MHILGQIFISISLVLSQKKGIETWLLRPLVQCIYTGWFKPYRTQKTQGWGQNHKATSQPSVLGHHRPASIFKTPFKWGFAGVLMVACFVYRQPMEKCTYRISIMPLFELCLEVIIKTWVHSQTQNKAQWLTACRHVSASSQSLRFILSWECTQVL